MLAQLLVPVSASGAATTFPEVGYLVVPYSVAGVRIHLLAVHGGGPGIIHWLVASTAYVMAFVLIMIVMRGLLDAAIADHTELDEVI